MAAWGIYSRAHALTALARKTRVVGAGRDRDALSRGAPKDLCPATQAFDAGSTRATDPRRRYADIDRA
jgi:hypothetical protein